MSLCFKLCNVVIHILCTVAAPVAGVNKSITFNVGEDLILAASFSDFNLALDNITWTQNSSISLVNRRDEINITNSDLSPPEANSTLTRLGITGLSYAGTYVATGTNRAGSNLTTFIVAILGIKLYS